MNKMHSTHEGGDRGAAFTIVSANYLAFAATLCTSFKKFHPNIEFYIIFVDNQYSALEEFSYLDAKFFNINDLEIPYLSSFVYRYSILELNTAVKPFTFDYLFRHTRHETIIYLDPDIWVHAPLEETFSGLVTAEVSLTPHIRKPYRDDHLPGDTEILQSGTYNLGYIGLRRSPRVMDFLDWWMDKLFLDCVVDIPKGLFVDQKWIDLIPGFFDQISIIRHPGYNAAYWNLHERPVHHQNGAFFVEDVPLVFFHFSGYSPFTPDRLSKHQNRHALSLTNSLSRLFDAYAAELLKHHHLKASGIPYGFQRLPNGVRLPLHIVRDALQSLLRRQIGFPDPLNDPDAFCRFLSRPNTLPGTPSPILHHFLLKRRPDVADAFPAARANPSEDRGFQDWLKTNGVVEEGIGDLLPWLAEEKSDPVDDVQDAFERLRQGQRWDVLAHFSDMWVDHEIFDEFAEWFVRYGEAEMGFTAAHRDALLKAYPNIVRVLCFYLAAGNLQSAFNILRPEGLYGFGDWMRHNAHKDGFNAEDVSLFQEFALANRSLLTKIVFLYAHFEEADRDAATIFNVDQRRNAIGAPLATRHLVNWLESEPAFPAVDQYRLALAQASVRTGRATGHLGKPGLPERRAFQFLASVRQELGQLPGQPRVNFAGFTLAPTGMGESSRSMAAKLNRLDIDLRAMALPTPRGLAGPPPMEPAFLGWPGVAADVSITVANADSDAYVGTVLPRHHWAPASVGYWVWETEELPIKWRDSQERYREIWAPSRYAADAIRRVIDRPVEVVPHTLQFASLDAAVADRARFGLPENGLLMGFFFDPHSVLERKNVHGLISAFEAAFAADDAAYLVLKVNAVQQQSLELGRLLARIEANDRILLINRRLSQADTFDLMASLDAYVSLHRSEGFGLTCAEAMALGLSVVATGYSGNMDFMTEQNSLLVPGKVISTHRPFGPYPAGTRWADPDQDQAASALRQLLDADLREALGKRAAQSIRQQLATDRLAQMVGRHIARLAEAAPAQPPAALEHAASARAVEQPTVRHLEFLSDATFKLYQQHAAKTPSLAEPPAPDPTMLGMVTAAASPMETPAARSVDQTARPRQGHTLVADIPADRGVLLYGGGAGCRHYLSRMTAVERGRIVGILDAYKPGSALYELPLYKPESFPADRRQKVGVIVTVTTREFESIRSSLQGLGFDMVLDAFDLITTEMFG